MYPLDLSVAAGAPAIAVFEFGNPNGDQIQKPPAYDCAYTVYAYTVYAQS